MVFKATGNGEEVEEWRARENNYLLRTIYFIRCKLTLFIGFLT